MDLADPSLTDLQPVGSGGFATVFSAHDVDFGRKVAVKVLHGLDATARRRFDRERMLMGHLSGHPNVITPFRYGLTPQDDPYLVMEFADGGSLTDVIARRGPIGWDQAVGYIRPIADALAYSHERGVIHKDVKPENILLTGAGVPKITDFGIASIQGHQLTSKGYTLEHSPPETFVSGVDDARDARSDLYSLASTLFTLVAGHSPFMVDGHDSAPALMRRIDMAPVPQLGNPAIDSFFARALAKDPADRPASAQEFIALLDHATNSQPGGATRLEPSFATRVDSVQAHTGAHGSAPIGQAHAAARDSAPSATQFVLRVAIVATLLVALGVGGFVAYRALVSDEGVDAADGSDGGSPDTAQDPGADTGDDGSGDATGDQQGLDGGDQGDNADNDSPSAELTAAEHAQNLIGTGDMAIFLRGALPQSADGLNASFTDDDCRAQLVANTQLYGTSYQGVLTAEAAAYPEPHGSRLEAFVNRVVEGYELCRDQQSIKPIGTHVLTAWASINAHLCVHGIARLDGLNPDGSDELPACGVSQTGEDVDAAERQICEALLAPAVEDFFASLADQKPDVAQACAAAQTDDPNWFG